MKQSGFGGRGGNRDRFARNDGRRRGRAGQASPWVSISAAAIASWGVLPAQRTNWNTG